MELFLTLVSGIAWMIVYEECARACLWDILLNFRPDLHLATHSRSKVSTIFKTSYRKQCVFLKLNSKTSWWIPG